MSARHDNGGQPTTWEEIVGSPDFERGYRDFWYQRPFDYRAADQGWEYDRGRHFAAWEKSQGRGYRRHITSPTTPLAPSGVQRELINTVVAAFVEKALI